ncbi:hypothetical protein SAMN06297251_11344 [Fulvimarina manganoxydans]|uniref:Uncharacterized protein n=1 Tax=Fulvimarina manganoxydans TaxID=937218 RepID=A0A1W2D7M6_9HYPH|nr:hypothetical protein SAMN06297251_11344 [Fulvimarina manganoxydans]
MLGGREVVKPVGRIVIALSETRCLVVRSFG